MSMSLSHTDYTLPPEYLPVDGILMSEHLASFPNGRQLLQAVLQHNTEVWMLTTDVSHLQRTRGRLAQRFGVSGTDMARLKPVPVATETVWARDWAPIFSYAAQDPGRIGLLDLQYYPERQIDDAAPAALTTFLNQTAPALGLDLFPRLHYERLAVDVEMEGGNLMCTDSDCFMTEEVLLRARQRDPEVQPQSLTAALEARLTQRFWMVPRMPHESTGHIDIWAKFLNAETVVVGQISDSSLVQVPPEQQAVYSDLQAFLEIQATGLDASGQPVPNSLARILQEQAPDVKIVRLPMPTPGVYRGVDTFRTYTNSLLLNDVAIVPRYRRGTSGPPRWGERLQNELDEAEVERIYAEAGYAVTWIVADNLIRDGGAWHCVAMQIPRLAGP
ncbi:MAG: agmatine deiminase family protein [Candidatus Sericytochromatia bacterium]|nr:agmatine deiminase family protein [Candidatus Sericytochromatia bacterium]